MMDKIQIPEENEDDFVTLRTMEKIADSLITGLRDFFAREHLGKAVIGISGGVDSAVTAQIAVKAIGKGNVSGLIMPYSKFSSPENLNDAKEVAVFLGLHHRVFFIDSFAEEFFKLQWIKTSPETSAMAKGNILARVRMVILYSWANMLNAAVLGTCNKTETLLGYETKFGDGASDVSVIGDLWKSEVWDLARYFKFPEKFITKKPSAELYEGQTDEGELGFTYAQADDILQKWEKGEPLPNNDTVSASILDKIKKSEHKRKMPFIIPKG